MEEDSNNKKKDEIPRINMRKLSTEERIAIAKKQWQSMKYFSGMMPYDDPDEVSQDDDEQD